MTDIPYVEGWTWDVWEIHFNDGALWNASLDPEGEHEAEGPRFLSVGYDTPEEALAESVAQYHEETARTGSDAR
jgi:hypothetical protein